MNAEKKEALRKTQKTCIFVQVAMCVIYVLFGILLFTTGRHCAADIPIYAVGAIITAGCMIALAVYELKLSKKLAG